MRKRLLLAILACGLSFGTPVQAKPNLCQAIRAGLNRSDVVEVYDIDFIMHSAGCDDDPYHPDTNWHPERGSSCARRAYWLVDHGSSILTTRQTLAVRGCVQFEDGTYDD